VVGAALGLRLRDDARRAIRLAHHLSPDAKAHLAAYEDVVLAVIERDHVLDLAERSSPVNGRRAGIIGFPAGLQQHDAEALVRRYRVAHQLAIARLEHMQRQARLRKEDEIRQRKQRKQELPLGPRGHGYFFFPLGMTANGRSATTLPPQ